MLIFSHFANYEHMEGPTASFRHRFDHSKVFASNERNSSVNYPVCSRLSKLKADLAREKAQKHQEEHFYSKLQEDNMLHCGVIRSGLGLLGRR